MKKLMLLSALSLGVLFASACETKAKSAEPTEIQEAKPPEATDNDPTTGSIDEANKNLRELKVDLNENAAKREADIDSKIAK